METIIRSFVWACVVYLAAGLVMVEPLATAADKLTEDTTAALIDELVLAERDTYPMDGQSYLRPEATTRINKAASQLIAAGKESWPQLFAHLDDKRRSTPSAEVIGPYDVGHKCYFLLREQIEDFPKGYPYQKDLAADRISFRPTLPVWLRRRQDCSLDEIRYEVLSILTDMESYANNQRAVELLKAHLSTVEKRIKFATQGQPSSVRSPTKIRDR